METADLLWTELHNLFEQDDGSLPEVRVNYVDGNAAASGYQMLRNEAVKIVSERPYFWSNVRNQEEAVDSVPNAAALVVSGEAAPFHVVLGGIQSGGVAIPHIGVLVFPDQLALDYRMGRGWNAEVLSAFFGLLANLTALDEDSSLTLEDGVSSDIADKFQRCWSEYQSRKVG